MSYINLTPTTVSILSKLLHITADTLIDGDVITNGMIKAGAITADKLAASIIELTKSQGIKGGGATLDTNGLTVRGNDGSYVVHGSNGMEFHDGNGNTFAMVGAMVMGTAKDGQWIKFTKPWKTVPNVIITPISLQTALPEYNSTNLYLDCRAQNITNNGFQAICRTVLKSGSGGSVPANKNIASWSISDDSGSGIPYNLNGWTNISDGSYYRKEIYYCLDIPQDASEGTVSVSVNINNVSEARGEGPNYGATSRSAHTKASVQLFKDATAISDEVVIAELDNKPGQAAYHQTARFNNSTSAARDIHFKSTGKITIKCIIVEGNGYYGSYHCSTGTFVLSSYSFNTTADVPLASGNAFFLCTDQHNSPYTISDS